jgi:hypothetical protein
MLTTILLSSTLLTGAAPSDCAGPPTVASGVVAVHGLVGERSSFSLAQLREMAQRSGAAERHPVFGFYKASFGHDLAIRMEQHINPATGQCGFVVTVTARLILMDRVVDIARDLGRTSCAPNSPESLLQARGA